MVVFRVDVANPPTSTSAVQSVQTWDALAPGITCADVSAISAGGVCTDPGDPGQPSFAQAATLSAIVWNRPASEVIRSRRLGHLHLRGHHPARNQRRHRPGRHRLGSLLRYREQHPGQVTPFFRRTTWTPPSQLPTRTPRPPATTRTSSLLRWRSANMWPRPSTNRATWAARFRRAPPSTQATIGEQVTYTVYADIPAHATVYSGVLTDPMPTGLTLLSASAGYSPSAGVVPPTQPLPPGVTFNSSTATLTLPAVLDNTSAVPLRFAVTIVARVTTAAANVAGVTRTNTATFTAGAAPSGLAPQPSTGSAQVAIVEPSPSLTKSASPSNVVGGQTVTYTLTASNAASASVLHEAWVVDCLPAGLTFDAYGTPTQGSTVTPTPGAGAPCAAGTTQVEWNVGDVNPGALQSLTYTATVTPAATGKQTFTNNATLTGDSLPGTRTGPTDPGPAGGRLYTKTASRMITVLGANLIKTASPTAATIGQTVTYTVTATLNANVSYFNLTGIDTLPAGLNSASVSLVSVSCVNLDGTTCTLPVPTPLTPVASGSGTKIGLFFGNVTGTTQNRIVTVVYSAQVADVAAAKAGATLTNSAHIAWDNTALPPPTSAGATFDQTSLECQRPDHGHRAQHVDHQVR